MMIGKETTYRFLLWTEGCESFRNADPFAISASAFLDLRFGDLVVFRDERPPFESSPDTIKNNVPPTLLNTNVPYNNRDKEALFLFDF